MAEDTEKKAGLMHWVALFWIGSGLMMILDARVSSRQDTMLLIACLVLTGVFAILGVALIILAARRSRGSRPTR